MRQGRSRRSQRHVAATPGDGVQRQPPHSPCSGLPAGRSWALLPRAIAQVPGLWPAVSRKPVPLTLSVQGGPQARSGQAFQGCCQAKSRANGTLWALSPGAGLPCKQNLRCFLSGKLPHATCNSALTRTPEMEPAQRNLPPLEEEAQEPAGVVPQGARLGPGDLGPQHSLRALSSTIYLHHSHQWRPGGQRS